MLGLLRCILFVTLSVSVSFAQDLVFSASTDARRILAGHYFEVTFTVKNGQGSSFQPPPFENFEIVNGPNRSSQMSIINGKVSQKQSFSYTLTSKVVGRYSIGQAKIRIGGKTLFSKPITIEVAEGNKDGIATDKVNSGEDNLFIEVECNYDTGYVGQQLTFEYILYTNQDVRSFNFIRLPEFDGFYVQDIQNNNERPQKVVIDGIQYVKRVLKVLALYPQQKGIFEIQSADIRLGISKKNARKSFFFNTDLTPVLRKSPEYKIHILDLPGDAPNSFSGGIGTFYLGTAIDKNNIAADDAIAMTFQIRGNGDHRFVLSSLQPFNDIFEIYEPNLLGEEVKQVGNQFEVIKTYEYLMLPKTSGTYTFQPEFSYFHPDSSKYNTIFGQKYTVTITGNPSHEVASINKEKIQLPSIFTTTRLFSVGEYFLFSRTFWIANGALSFAFLSLLLIKRIQLNRSNEDISVIRTNRAKKFALRQLSLAREALDKEEFQDYYQKLRKALLDYLSDKTNMNSTMISKDELSLVLKKYELSSFESDLFLILQRGEQALYAHISSGEERQDYRKALEIIENMETWLKK